MNISIFASVGCQNLGDELIIQNEVQALRKRYGYDTSFRIFSYDIENPFFQDKAVEYIEYFPVGIKKPKNILRNIRNCFSFLTTLLWSDLVVIGGGGLFYEQELQSVRNPLDIWKYRIDWISFFGKKVLFFAVGIDIESDAGKKKLKKIFGYKRAEVTVRDTESFFTLQSLGIKSTVVDDPVFFENFQGDTKGVIKSCLDSRNFSIKDISKFSYKDKIVGVALRKGYIGKFQNEKLEIAMIEEILQAIEKKGGKIVLLPHSFHETDEIANDVVFLKNFLGEGREMRCTMQDVYNTYVHNEIDICISMRLHSIILAYQYGINIIALSYSKKTHETLKKLSK